MAPVAVKYPPFVSASRWSTLTDQLADLVKRKRGTTALTNADVVRVIMAWLAALPRTRHRELFPLWHQFAAAAYGWSPKTNRFDTSAKRAAAEYSEDLAAELWSTMRELAGRLDGELMPNPRLDLDGSFMDLVFIGEVKAQLAQDGAQAQGIPLPACRDKAGKVRFPRPAMPGAVVRRNADGSCYYVDPITGGKVQCDCPGECSPVVVDPFAPSKRLLLVALIVIAWVAYDNQPRHRRKRVNYGT